ncbi:efflux RND transporter periplasmic adaptor subunit [Dongshaea marina]|uniref:efflux RND transporter periplasmic adaptor subunit n=1 Tax=Dongshaea marina TaxID=2047966 RepID=UPI000D3E0537|nr:efflux RND transporter periplasmic adaptor subunit [Dongshaea marina]
MLQTGVKRTLIAGALCGLITFNAYALDMDMKATNDNAVTVATVQAEKVPFTKTIIGHLVSPDEVSLIARVGGFIKAKDFTDGGFVHKGQLLYQLEEQPYKAEVEQAKAQLQKQESELANAKLSLKRQARLLKKGSTSREAYDNALNDQKKAEADLLNAQADLEIAQTNFSYTKITAPFDGRMSFAKYSVGNYVDQSSQPLASIVRMDPIYVDFNPSETLYVANQAGKDSFSNVTLKLKLSTGAVYPETGKIIAVDNSVDSGTGTIAVRGELANPDHKLLPGQYVQVMLEKSAANKSLLIPQRAVVMGSQGAYVWVIKADQHVERRPVELGMPHGKQVVVTQGLKAGEQVVTTGLQQLDPAKKVLIKQP